MDELLEALSADGRFGAAILFGSAARGSLRDGSDVDIAVLLLDAVARASLAHGRLLFDRSGGRLRALAVRTLIEYFDGEYQRRLIDEAHRRRLEQALG